ncbi:hypothetical protein NKDENANG_01848 [Candidatus Entotheonellaceae bacterium PAL068K]
MSITLPTDLFRLPSVQRFLSLLVDDLASRRSLLVLLPAAIDPVEVWATLRDEILRRDFEFETVSLAKVSNERSPVAALSHIFEVHWPSPDLPRTVANLMALEQLPDAVLLEDFDQLPSTAREAWTTFLRDWSQASQSRADSGHSPTALCIVTPGGSVLCRIPANSMHFAVHWWWGFPSALEIRFLCRSSNSRESRKPIEHWREYVLPGLVGNDVSLAAYLWDHMQGDFESLLTHLRIFAERCNWKTGVLKEWDKGIREAVLNRAWNRGRPFPPSELRPLWAYGAVGWTLEYGLELHTAALAVLKQREGLRHRLWRGQAELLLPYVDHIRLGLCKHLTRVLGPDWPVRWYQPTSQEEDQTVRDNPLACQWGYLDTLLKKGAIPRSERRWSTLASRVRWIRNEIAHYRPVTFGDFEAVLRETARFSPLLASHF